MSKHSAGQIRRATLLALLLPEAERQELWRRYSVNPAGWSLALGIVQFFGGLFLYINWYARIGVRGWPGWAIDLMSLIGLLIAMVGVLRVFNYVAHRQAFGEPLVWLLLRFLQWVRRIDESRREREKFGPQRPDRALRESDGPLLVLACRPKPDWEIGVSVKIEDDFFEITAIEERPDGEHSAVAYVLEELPESAPIRALQQPDVRLPHQ